MTTAFGVSQPISMASPTVQDQQLQAALTETLNEFQSYEPQQESEQRVQVLLALNKLAKKWIQSLADVRLGKGKENGGKLIAFGSYRLNVHSSGGDIDTVLVAPRHINRKDFFHSFKDLLLSDPSASDVCPVEKAFVPLITLNYQGVEIDILFAQMALTHVPEDLDLSDDSLLKNLDEESIRSLNGFRVAEQILKLVPQQKEFCIALRAIKLWAKNHGIYSNSMGFFGGITWAILVARVCQLYPNANAAKLIQKTFFVFSTWNWPLPVVLSHISASDNSRLSNLVWDPRRNYADRFHLMPIITPAFPEQNSTFNVSQSSLHIIQESMKEAQKICKDINDKKASWKDLFEEVNYFSMHKHFIALTLKAATEKDELEYSGFFESRIRQLVQILERNHAIKIAHVCPKKFKSDKENQSKSVWFIGLDFQDHAKNLDLTDEIERFKFNVTKQAASVRELGQYNLVDIDIFYVKRSNLISIIPARELKKGKIQKSPMTSPESKQVNKKRPLTSNNSNMNIQNAAVKRSKF